MNMIKERSYIKEITSLFEPFFALFPTKDMNELSTKLTEEYVNGWQASTTIRRNQKEGRSLESMDFGINARTNEIRGFYSNGYIDVEKERTCQLELTANGLAVRSDSKQANITEADQERIKKFKYLSQHLELNTEMLESLKLNSVEFTETNSYKKAEDPYRKDARKIKYSLSYELNACHTLLETLKAHFDIEEVLKKEHVTCELILTGNYTMDLADELVFYGMQGIRIIIGNFSEEGSVSISQNISYDQQPLKRNP